MFVSVLGQTAERKKKEEERKIVGFRSRQIMGSGDLKRIFQTKIMNVLKVENPVLFICFNTLMIGDDRRSQS